MEPMLEPFEERSFAAVSATVESCVRRRSRRRRRLIPRQPALPAGTMMARPALESSEAAWHAVCAYPTRLGSEKIVAAPARWSGQARPLPRAWQASETQGEYQR